MNLDIETIEKSLSVLHDIFDRADMEVEWKKIQRKMEEAKYNPGDVRPLADCIYSLLLGARSLGFTAHVVLRELEKVAAENLSRRWKKMPDGTYQAIPPD